MKTARQPATSRRRNRYGVAKRIGTVPMRFVLYAVYYTNMRHTLGSIFILLGIVLLLATQVPVFAQVSQSDVLKHRQELENELSQIEREIESQRQLLEEKQRERVSIERDLAIIQAKIDKARLEIRARDLVIQRLSRDIAGKEDTIGDLNKKLGREKESLAQLIRRTNQIDELSMVEIILSNQSLSDFFEDIDAFTAIKDSLQQSFTDIEVTKDDTRAEKQALENKKNEQLELRQLQELQKQKIEQQEAEKQEILAATKRVEDRYQEFIAEKEQTAAQIRAQLFALRDSAPIPFGEALELAQRASEKTGVRPALILGVLSQETNLGENLGTGSWRTDMHPRRDQPIFPYITDTLGLDPDQMPVSAAPGYGWGGAMGPAQFIPSTWVCYGGFIHEKSGKCTKGSYSWDGPWKYDASRDRIRNALGKNSPSNPWNNQDAFTASALLLMDNGAAKGGRSAERLAALRYFAGWVNAENPAYGFYGDGVMELADKWQRQIDILAEG